MFVRTRLEKSIFLVAFLAQAGILWYYGTRSWFWGDEAYSAQHTFLRPWLSYLAGGAPEGNVAPLSYLITKATLGFWQLTLFTRDPVPWLRLVLSVIPVSLFSAFSCVAAAKSHLGLEQGEDAEKTLVLKILFALCIFLSLNGTHAYFAYAWQARPYGLWLCFSWLFTWSLFSQRIRVLVPVSLALVATVPMAAAQVALGMAYLFFFDEGDWKERLKTSLYLLPALLLGAFYSLKVQSYPYSWPGVIEMVKLVAAHAKYWLVVPTVVFLFLDRSLWRRQTLFLFAGFAGIALVICWQLYGMQKPNGFTISNRYFIFLLPAMLAIFLRVITSNKFLQLRIFVFVLIGGMGFYRLLAEQSVFAGESRSVAVSTQIAALNKDKARIPPGNFCFCFEEASKDIEVDAWFSAAFLVGYTNGRQGSRCDRYAGIRPFRNTEHRAAKLLYSTSSYDSISGSFVCEWKDGRKAPTFEQLMDKIPLQLQQQQQQQQKN